MPCHVMSVCPQSAARSVATVATNRCNRDASICSQPASQPEQPQQQHPSLESLAQSANTPPSSHPSSQAAPNHIPVMRHDEETSEVSTPTALSPSPRTSERREKVVCGSAYPSIHPPPSTALSVCAAPFTHTAATHTLLYVYRQP
mmetsp:Transcript_34588/g.85765  ORF Transcript_34588/g.85765 Transcript_34588/m.85765 type:complete len:145 (-) Transcript_34588:793-1227(-)